MVEDVEVDEGVEEVEEEVEVERVVLLEVSPNKKLVRSSMNPAEVEVEVVEQWLRIEHQVKRQTHNPHQKCF